MYETQEATLESLKAGDTAYIKGSGVYSTMLKITVTKITATQIVDSNGKRYHRNDGYSTEKQTRWGGRDRLLPATPEYTAQYERQENLALIERTNMRALSDEQLAAITKVLRGE
jgi:hypothetical protein